MLIRSAICRVTWPDEFCLVRGDPPRTPSGAALGMHAISGWLVLARLSLFPAPTTGDSCSQRHLLALLFLTTPQGVNDSALGQFKSSPLAAQDVVVL